MTTRHGLTTALAILILVCVTGAAPAELLVGSASREITPEKPVPLCGQFHLRISRGVDTPVTACVLALESRAGDRSVDSAIMVACDVVYIPHDVLQLVRQEVQRRVPGPDLGRGEPAHDQPRARPHGGVTA